MEPRNLPDVTEITPSAGVERACHGWRAKCLQRLVRMRLPVPRSFAIPSETVQSIATGKPVDLGALSDLFSEGDGLVSVRPSALMPEWGGPGTILNVGINDRTHKRLAHRIGRANADTLYRRFVQSYAIHIARLDPDMFAQEGEGALAEALRSYRDETDEDFPQDPATQLAEVLRSMARAWDGPTARLLRQAKGAPPDAPLGLVVQQMALGLGPGLCGSGSIQFVDSATGAPRVTGRFKRQHHGGADGAGAEAGARAMRHRLVEGNARHRHVDPRQVLGVAAAQEAGGPAKGVLERQAAQIGPCEGLIHLSFRVFQGHRRSPHCRGSWWPGPSCPARARCPNRLASPAFAAIRPHPSDRTMQPAQPLVTGAEGMIRR